MTNNLSNEMREINLLSDFLAAFEPVIQPRDASSLPVEERDLLTRIAEGGCTDQDRAQAVALLNSKSDALEFFAQQLVKN